MIIPRLPFVNRPECIEKYKNRNTRIFFKSNQSWIKGTSFCSNKSDADVFTILDAIERTKFFVGDNVEYHVEDSFGNERPSINDFDEEQIYNCPSVTWDTDYRKGK